MKELTRKFEAANFTVKVKRLKKVNKGKDHGEFDDKDFTIRVEKGDFDKELHIFCHEKFHCYCEVIRQLYPKFEKLVDEMDDNEEFNDIWSALDAQFYKNLK